MIASLWYLTVRRIVLGAISCLFLPCLVFGPAQANLTYHGGPVMTDPVRVYLIYWTPPGVVLDNSVADNTGNFISLTQQFFFEVSGSDFLNLWTQYPGTCNRKPCVFSNHAGAISANVWVDTQAYPHPGNKFDSGTQANPLTDQDIRDEVSRGITQNGWIADNHSLFFVITGIFASSRTPVEECKDAVGCTFRGQAFCGYHGNVDSKYYYSYIADASFLRNGCDEGILAQLNAISGTPVSVAPVNGQLASERELALMTHELMEAITNPEGTAWWDNGNENGDLCNQVPVVLYRKVHNYIVQKGWSNISSACEPYSWPERAIVNYLLEPKHHR